MKALDQWRQQEELERAGRLGVEEALLTGHTLVYLWHRSRLFLLRVGLAQALHVVEFFLLFRVFSTRIFLSLLVLRISVLLLSALWWGLLESLRNRLRALSPREQAQEISRSIGPWLILSLLLAGLSLLGSLGFLIRGVLANDGIIGLYHVAPFLLVLRFSLDLPVRVLHAGVYAFRRVYRPAEWVLGLEILGFALPLALWNLWGPWSFAVALGLSPLLSAGASFFFTARAYQGLRIPFPRPRWAWPRPVRALPAFAYAFLRLESVLLLPLAWEGLRSDGVSDWLYLLHLSLPLVAAASDWALLFYFDAHKLRRRSLTTWRLGFLRSLFAASAAMGLVAWIVVALSLRITTGAVPLSYLVAFLPVLLVRSLTAGIQLESFVRKHYALLVGTGLAKLALLTLVSAFWSDAAPIVFAAGLSLALLIPGFVSLLRLRQDEDHASEREISWPPARWRQRLEQLPGPGRLRVYVADSGHACGILLREWARREPLAELTRQGQRGVAGFSTAEENIAAVELVIATGGRVRLSLEHDFRNGSEAVSLLSSPDGRIRPQPRASLALLQTEFQRQFEIQAWELGPHGTRMILPPDLRGALPGIWKAALAAIEQGEPCGQWGKWEVYPWAPTGRLETCFVLNRHQHPLERRMEWRRIIS